MNVEAVYLETKEHSHYDERPSPVEDNDSYTASSNIAPSSLITNSKIVRFSTNVTCQEAAQNHFQSPQQSRVLWYNRSELQKIKQKTKGRRLKELEKLRKKVHLQQKQTKQHEGDDKETHGPVNQSQPVRPPKMHAKANESDVSWSRTTCH
jgi:hypothetical protein